MRSFAYGAAILAAVGMMVFITMMPSDTTPDLSEPASQDVDGSVVDAEIQQASLTLNVPEMHCPFACYPSVKKTLEGREDVASVELVPQKEEGIIDNPQVVVTYKEGFNPDNAITMLTDAGFGGSTVVDE